MIKSSSCYVAVSESRRCCERDTAISVNGLMRADESPEQVVTDGERFRYLPQLHFCAALRGRVCANMGGTAG